MVANSELHCRGRCRFNSCPRSILLSLQKSDKHRAREPRNLTHELSHESAHENAHESVHEDVHGNVHGNAHEG